MIIFGSHRLLDNPPTTLTQLLADRPELRGVNVVTDALAARWVS